MALIGYPSSIQYRSLNPRGDEIRLLELRSPLTGDIDEPIVCHLVHKTIGESLGYIALSSLYGDMSITEHIQIDSAPVAIPLQVSQALRYVRAVFLAQGPPKSTSLCFQSQKCSELSSSKPQKKTPRGLLSLMKQIRDTFAESTSRSSTPSLYVWLGLLSINPRDACEMSQKLSHVTRAYRNAALAVGWLGTKDQTSDLAIEIIRAWDRCIPESFGEPKDREAHPEHYAPVLSWMRPVAHLSEIPQGITDPREVPSYKAISQFLNRPFFHNAWLLDEMSLARSPVFLLGDDIVSWMQVLRLNRVNEDIGDQGADMFPDELRHLLQYMPLGSVFTFLKDFDRRQKHNQHNGVQQAQGWDL